MRTRVEEQLPIEENGHRVSHLALSLDRPATTLDPTLAVLYMHGFGSRKSGDKATFFRRRFLQFGLAFCALDFQGHGDSGGNLADLTLSRNLADIGRAHGHLRSLGYSRLVFFGSSMGAAAALWYAALHPEDVAAAVHIAPALAMDESLLERVGPAAARRWQQEGTLYFPHEQAPTELHWELIEDLRRFDLERLKALYRSPTLIFQGQRDASVPWRHRLVPSR